MANKTDHRFKIIQISLLLFYWSPSPVLFMRTMTTMKMQNLFKQVLPRMYSVTK